MKIFSAILLQLFFICLLLYVNRLIYRTIVRRALSAHILPYLAKYKCILIKTKYPGFLSQGAFSSDLIGNKEPLIQGSFSQVSPYRYSYIDVYYENESGEKKKLTAKIRTFFFLREKC